MSAMDEVSMAGDAPDAQVLVIVVKGLVLDVQAGIHDSDAHTRAGVENGDMASAAAYEQELREYQNAAAAYISEEVLGNQPLDVVCWMSRPVSTIAMRIPAPV